MKKLVIMLFFIFIGVIGVYAQEQQQGTTNPEALKSRASYFQWSEIAAAVALAFAACGCGIGQGIAVNGAMLGIARQPEATKQIQANMILGLAFIESLTIYALLLSLILLFVNPFSKYIL